MFGVKLVNENDYDVKMYTCVRKNFYDEWKKSNEKETTKGLTG